MNDNGMTSRLSEHELVLLRLADNGAPLTVMTQISSGRRRPPPPPTMTMLAGGQFDPDDQAGLRRILEDRPLPDHLYFGGWAGLFPGEPYFVAARRVLKDLADLEQQKRKIG